MRKNPVCAPISTADSRRMPNRMDFWLFMAVLTRSPMKSPCPKGADPLVEWAIQESIYANENRSGRSFW